MTTDNLISASPKNQADSGYSPPSIFDGSVSPRLIHGLQGLVDDYGHEGVESALRQLADGALAAT
jgi:hypothetical protein